MNICFFIGKIISDIDFKFIVGNKNNASVAIFKLKVNENCILTVKGYNKLADLCYRKLSINNYIILQGELNSKMEVILYSIELF